MGAERLPQDGPLVRLFNPVESDQPWTLQRVFEEFRWPELSPKASAGDGLRWIALWREFEAIVASNPDNCRRVTQPSAVASDKSTPPQLGVHEITSRHLLAFQDWLREKYPPPKGASTINKAVREVVHLLKLAASEGIEVGSYRSPKNLPTLARPRYYFDDAAIERLWAAAEAMSWPPALKTGVKPVVFWRSLIILLRTYGPRVQDFVSYTRAKQGLQWSAITLEPRSPNPESLESWPLGWLYYQADKTRQSSGRKYFLPLTPAARAAVDRLAAGAFALHGGVVPADARVFAVPKSNTLPTTFTKLQRAADVATRDSTPYTLEDFRKTVATYSAAVDPGLPHALCGWGGGGVQQKHYQQPEVLLVRRLCNVRMPECFSTWVDREQSAAVDSYVSKLG